MNTKKKYRIYSETDTIQDSCIEAGFFSGRLDFSKFPKENYPVLQESEKDFLEGQVETACSLVQDWDIWKKRELPKDVWEYLRKRKFMGMAIPEDYYGQGFTALGQSEIFAKIATRSSSLCLAAMMPDYLGPALFLLRYGTQEQKLQYLPRLAIGEEIPCLIFNHTDTSFENSSREAEGIVFQGEKGPCLRLSWNKCYIPLANAATLLCVGFDFKDPENFFHKGCNPGITFALVPASHHGVMIDRQHDTMGIPFSNAPVEGHDVVISVDSIIGGQDGIGKGWAMMEEFLYTKRCIMFPSMANGFTRLAFRMAGAYSLIQNLGDNEEVDEILARIGGFTYLLEAACKYTSGFVEKNPHIPVASAILKYHSSEIAGKVINDAMKILGPKALMRGPKNMLSCIYSTLPVLMNLVEPNLCLRNSQTFWKAFYSFHPCFSQKITSSLWGRVVQSLKNAFRYFFLSIPVFYFPAISKNRYTKRCYQKISWACSGFALLADLNAIRIEKKEKNALKLWDFLSYLYWSICILKRYEAEEKTEDLPFMKWSMEYCFCEMQKIMESLLEKPNIPFFLKYPLLWWSRLHHFATCPCDTIEKEIVKIMKTPCPQRNRLADNVYIPQNAMQPLNQLEKTFELAFEAKAIQEKIQEAMPEEIFSSLSWEEREKVALEKNIISEKEAQALYKFYCDRNNVLQVDSFSRSEYHSGT